MLFIILPAAPTMRSGWRCIGAQNYEINLFSQKISQINATNQSASTCWSTHEVF